ncbi:hypothetical protein DUNSADRAFT_14743 [Dunaliella salina]|uniref:DNA2/NAM7 helicase-like C-terminal domain-containing protein n=1 Tax=Dunaliella salina TaxID=3046 RepID=A0ABQ7G6T4_DUNSA|nr:hypothetical protein DUNSADRAFT_14743 [Dunaliella salina]|eukprot:KAF5830331.1 hypothetical protein DUNSADRAFT_14743 [Dunaliella salina]
MNVAITRAKRSLWVLGHAASLRQHHVWKELLQDAQDRGCVVEEANGDDPTLLPRFAELVRQREGLMEQPPAPPLSLPMGLAAAPPVAATATLIQGQHQAPVPLQPQSHIHPLPPHPQQPAPSYQSVALQPLITQHQAPLHMPAFEGNLDHPRDPRPAARQPPHPQHTPLAPSHIPLQQQQQQQQQQYPLLQRHLQLLQQREQQHGAQPLQPPAMHSSRVQQSLLLGLPLQTSGAQGPHQLQHQQQQQKQPQ